MFAGHSRRTAAVNHLVIASPVAEHGVGVARASCHKVLAELNHLNFRVQRAGVLNRPADLRFVSQDEHVAEASLRLDYCRREIFYRSW